MSLVLRDVRLNSKKSCTELEFGLAKKVTALFGPSGSGKTTVLELVAGLRRPAEGAIELDGVDLSDVSAGIFVPPRERAIGYVPQDLALFPHLYCAPKYPLWLETTRITKFENFLRETLPLAGYRTLVGSQARFSLRGRETARRHRTSASRVSKAASL